VFFLAKYKIGKNYQILVNKNVTKHNIIQIKKNEESVHRTQMFLLLAKVRTDGRKEGRKEGSITISLRNFVGEGIKMKKVSIGHRCVCCC
jgi:cell division protein YceG involved in septum cleavage